MSEVKKQRIEELEKALEEQKEVTARAESNFDKLYKQWSEVSAQCKALEMENNRLMEKLDVAEQKLEKANFAFKDELANRADAEHRYAEVKKKNQEICSYIAEMVRKIMQE